MKYDNAPAARIVLENRVKYGPPGSLMLRWAIRIVRPDLAREYETLCDHAWAMRRQPDWSEADCRGATVGSIDALHEAGLIEREAGR